MHMSVDTLAGGLRTGRDARSWRVSRAGRGVDIPAAEAAVRSLLVALGQDPDAEHLARTPRGVAAAYAEWLTPGDFEFTSFPNDEGYDRLVLARDIPFRSLCEHHLLPFYGVAHVGYLPAERLVGLSKLARVVEAFARGLQVQERMTRQIADCLDARLRPKGIGVVLEAEHLCMSLRGVRALGSRTVTSELSGHLRRNAAARQEFYALARARLAGGPTSAGQGPRHEQPGQYHEEVRLDGRQPGTDHIFAAGRAA
jgi:GTP cyclohydrolase IA